MPLEIPKRISGTAAARPSASAAIGCRYLATDTGLIYESNGTDWIQVTTLSRELAEKCIGGTLAARPTYSTCIGFLYTDENGYDYEAFPGAWVQVNVVDDDVPAIAAVTATADGLTTGIIPARAKFVQVTSANADHIVTLPPPVIDKEVVINVGANGFELRSSVPATIAINTGTGASAESAIPANSTILGKCITATAWKFVRIGTPFTIGAALPAFTDPPSAAEMAALRALVNEIRTALLALNVEAAA